MKKEMQEMNGDWRECKLEDVTEIIDSLHKTPTYVENGLPMVRVTDIRGGRLDLSSTLKVDEKTFAEFSAKHTPKLGDIVFTRVGSYGKSCIVKTTDKFCLGQNTVFIIPKEDPYYLYYFLNSSLGLNEIESSVAGSTQPTISLKSIRAFNIPLPALPEQRAIAEILSSLDDKIDLLHRQNKTLESLAETLFRQWFIEEAGEDWEARLLSDVADIKIGRTPPRKESRWFSKDENDIKWISIKDLGNQGVFIFNTQEFLTREAVKKFKIPIIPKNTVVLSFKMTVGRVAITSTEMLSNEAIAHFKIKDEQAICKEFLYFYLKSFKYETLGSTSSIVTSINSEMIKNMPIFLPSSKNIQNFKAQAELIFDLIKRNQLQINSIEQLRDTLLPKLMSGEIRVQDNQ
jgi:type I restriction enzyme S subunit